MPNKLKSRLKANEGYCVCCKDRSVVKETCIYITAKNVPMLRGLCGKCGTTVCKFLSKSDSRLRDV